MYSAYKLNKQGNNIHSFSYLGPVCCSMSSSNCCFLTCIQVSQEAGQVVWCSHLFDIFSNSQIHALSRMCKERYITSILPWNRHFCIWKSKWKCLSLNCVRLLATPRTVVLLCPWNSPGKNTGVGCYSLLWRFSRPRDWIQVSCIVGAFFTVWTTRVYLRIRKYQTSSNWGTFTKWLLYIVPIYLGHDSHRKSVKLLHLKTEDWTVESNVILDWILDQIFKEKIRLLRVPWTARRSH